MKKFLVSVLLLPVLAVAQEPIIIEKSVVCANVSTLLNGLKDHYDELPIWIGQDEKSRYSLFVSKTGSWTLVQFSDEIACILGVGTNSREIFQGSKI
jgi:hypothetical protein